MDRQIVYVSAIPQDTDLLLTNKNTMVGLGLLIQALLGTSTWVDGLACAPTSPASLAVNVAQGSIYSLESVDASAYGSLAADTSHQIMKQGGVLGTTQFSCPAPSTSGQSIVYLLEAAYEDVDGGPTVLPYYNASNPSQAYNGPNNTGVSQNTVRQGICQLQLKAGTAAATGTQMTPTPDAGFTGLYAITVANGQSTVTSGNIQQVSGAPFISPKLTALSVLASLNIGAGLYNDGSGNLATHALRGTLTSNLSLYVSTTGNDANTGSSGSPFLTIQKAINTASAYDLYGSTVTINVADGTYTGTINVSQPFMGGTVTIVGDIATPANCLIQVTGGNAITVQNGAQLNLSGLKIATITSGHGIIANAAGVVNMVGNMEFGASPSGYAHMFAQFGSLISATNSYRITGNAGFHWLTSNNSNIEIGAPTITLVGPPAFTDFASVSNCSCLSVLSGTTSFSGTATGTRYSATANGTIETNGGGATYFPGNASGSVSTGGVYA